MSIRLMTFVWDIEFPTQGQKLLMLKLADYASDSGGSVFPANETMSRKIGCDERTVQRAMKAFRSVGLIHLVRQGGGKPGSTNEWKVNVGLLVELATGKMFLKGHAGELFLEENTGGNLPPVTPGNLSGGVTNEAGGVTPVSPTPGTSVTQSSINHQIDSPVARERASDKSARAPSAKTPPSGPALVVKKGDTQFAAWMDYLSATNQDALVAQAMLAEALVVTARWPKEGAQVVAVRGAARAINDRKMAAAGDA